MFKPKPSRKDQWSRAQHAENARFIHERTIPSRLCQTKECKMSACQQSQYQFCGACWQARITKQ